VRDKHESHAQLALQALELDLHARAEFGIERGERLVEQEHLGLGGEGTGERHALPLAAGKLVRHTVFKSLQRDQRDRVGDLFGNFRIRAFLHAQAKGNVVAHGQVRKKRVALEDLVHIAPVGREVGHIFAPEQNGARLRRFEARDHAQERCLPAAGRPQESEELASAHLQAHIIDGRETAEAFRHARYFDHRRVATHA